MVQSPKIMVVDDEPSMLGAVRRMLGRDGFEVTSFSTAHAALEALADQAPDVLLTDLHMPGMDGFQLLGRVRELQPGLPVVVMTGATSVATAVRAMKHGAYDYLVKPLDPAEALSATMHRALEHGRLWRRNRLLEERVSLSERFDRMVGDSEGMRDVYALIESVADVDTSVLILGESGSGKELVARAIHERSPRGAGRFVAINCGALTESVLESELFGHVQGAFTGAVRARRGLFEEASGSTLFLDEVGELPPATQVKLLRVLQEGEVRPVGSNEQRSVDVRILAATHQNLRTLMREGKFRDDLYYRLNVVSVDVPPLRERRADIAPLTAHFIDKHAARMRRPVRCVDPEAMELLQAYPWPGNVRELENVIQRAIALGKGSVIDPALLPTHVRRPEMSSWTPATDIGERPLAEAKEAFEAAYLERALMRAQGSIAEAARGAGIDPSNLRRLLKRHGIEPRTFRTRRR